ncbi:hypothetical protein CK486_01150 [Pseudomonas sp. HAR-UPW-AIA-41]|nr:hypothetical protein CK486_01150 [Pseudomonas sp. HAR-UPW-AIA-41]
MELLEVDSVGEKQLAFVGCVVAFGSVFFSSSAFLAFYLNRLIVFPVNFFLVFSKFFHRLQRASVAIFCKCRSSGAECENSNKCNICNLHKLGLVQLQ